MNLPHDFVSYTRQLMGDALFDRLASALDTAETPASIRLNPLKSGGADAAPALYDCAVPWCPSTGRYLKSRPNYTFDPLLHAGAYYVQEAASMFVDYVVRQLISSPVLMLDLCAAPGGKSTALRAALPEGSLLMANEPMRTRAQILSENLQKFGHEDVIVTNNYPRDYRKAAITFDAILADVPCSGEGMFRKDDGARAEWSMQNVDNCWRLQREIISDIWECLKPGGLLIYSTCTFNAHEDEENVQWIASELGADILELPIDNAWNITGALEGEAPVCRFMPGVSRSEGLFMAVLRKHGHTDTMAIDCFDNSGTARPTRKKARAMAAKGSTRRPAASDVTVPLLHAERFGTVQQADSVVAIPTRWAELYHRACASLKVIHAGVTLGTAKGRDIIPSQSLAMSRLLQPEAFARVELSYQEAMSFLRKEAVPLPDGTPRGYVAVTYHGHTLGFEKNIGNRANNLYPQEWRIKSTHVPTDMVEVICKTL